MTRFALLFAVSFLAFGCSETIIGSDDDDATPEPHPEPVFDGVEGTLTYDITYTEGAAVEEIGECTEVYSMSGIDASGNAPGELAELQEVCPGCTELLNVFFTTVEDDCPGGAGVPDDTRMAFDRSSVEGQVTLWWKAGDDWYELNSGELDYDLTTIVYDNPDSGGWGPWGGNVTNDDPCRFIAPCRWDGVYTIEADLGSNEHPDDVGDE